jgi:hypothetical protein
MSEETEKPTLKVWRNPGTGQLSFKLPRKGARWQGKLANLDEVQKAIRAELDPPFIIDYVGEEERHAE